MHNIRFVLEYDGSAFHGWQSQPKVRTVQDELQKVLATVLRLDEIVVFGAGRTDAGVHARGQVAHFFVSQLPDLNKLRHSVSQMLRGELSVVAAEEVSMDFHALRSAVSKEYLYTLYTRSAPPVLDRGRVWHVWSGIRPEFLKHEAGCLVGEHDFTSFQGAGCSSPTAVKEIFEIAMEEEGPYLRLRFTGAGFLKHMVRNMVGTLVDLSKERLELKSVKAVLAAKDRKAAGITAPPQGLCLERVNYSE